MKATQLGTLSLNKPELKRKDKPQSKKKEEQKIKSYEDIRAEARNKVASEKRNKQKVENTRIPAKTSSRSMVKPTKLTKSKASEDENLMSQPIKEESVEESQRDYETEYRPLTIGPTFTKKQKKYIDTIVEKKLVEHEAEYSEYFSNFQLEMMRQFMIQRDEMLDCMRRKLKSDLDKYLF